MREITYELLQDEYEVSATQMRWQSFALLALQESAEYYLVHLFEDA